MQCSWSVWSGCAPPPTGLKTSAVAAARAKRGCGSSGDAALGESTGRSTIVEGRPAGRSSLERVEGPSLYRPVWW